MTAFADLVDEIAASLKPSCPQAGYPAAVRDFAETMKAAEARWHATAAAGAGKYGLKACRECGAPMLNSYPPQRARGGYWHPDVPMDVYEAVNLLEALKIVKDTGDWHGQLRLRCEAVIEAYGHGDARPNATAEEMRP